MMRKTGHVNAGLRRRVGADVARRSTRRALLLGAAAWPLIATVEAAYAQPKQAPDVIGWLNTGSRNANANRLAAFKEGFATLGWKEGLDYVLEERWADGRTTRLQALAEELAAKRPALIVAAPSQAVAAATRAAPNTPIVIANGDPFATGVVANLARPGGMVTGLSNVNTETTEKFLELLLVAVPKLRRVGFLADPTTGSYSASLQGAQALILLSSSWFVVERQRLVRLAHEHRWPLVATQSDFTEDGALLSYGVDRTALYRRAAYYVDRILNGAKPGDLPIEQPTKFELVVNAKTAKALGLAITPELRLRADRVIE